MNGGASKRAVLCGRQRQITSIQILQQPFTSYMILSEWFCSPFLSFPRYKTGERTRTPQCDVKICKGYKCAYMCLRRHQMVEVIVFQAGTVQGVFMLDVCVLGQIYQLEIFCPTHRLQPSLCSGLYLISASPAPCSRPRLIFLKFCFYHVMIQKEKINKTFLIKHFTKENKWKAKKHMKMCSIFLVFKEMKIKATVRSHQTTVNGLN